MAGTGTLSCGLACWSPQCHLPSGRSIVWQWPDPGRCHHGRRDQVIQTRQGLETEHMGFFTPLGALTLQDLCLQMSLPTVRFWHICSRFLPYRSSGAITPRVYSMTWVLWDASHSLAAALDNARGIPVEGSSLRNLSTPRTGIRTTGSVREAVRRIAIRLL